MQGLHALALKPPAPPGSGVQPLHLPHRVGRNSSRAVRGALEREIVNDDRLAVPRQVDVERDAVGALVEGQLECGNGVLGRVG